MVYFRQVETLRSDKFRFRTYNRYNEECEGWEEYVKYKGANFATSEAEQKYLSEIAKNDPHWRDALQALGRIYISKQKYEEILNDMKYAVVDTDDLVYLIEHNESLGIIFIRFRAFTYEPIVKHDLDKLTEIRDWICKNNPDHERLPSIAQEIIKRREVERW